MRNKKQRKKMLMLVLLLAVTVGFALLSTTLKINGIAGIKGNKWDIHWDENSIVETEGSVEAKTAAYVSDSAKKIVTFDVDLELPGDFYEFTLDAKNYGTIAGAVEQVKITFYDENDQEIEPEDMPDYIIYSFTHADGTAVQQGEILKPTKSRTYKFRIEYDSSLTELPSDTIPKLKPIIEPIFVPTTLPEHPKYNAGDIVYFDPVSTDPCNASTYNLTNINNGTSTCYKWRVMETNDSKRKDDITLQLDHSLIESEWGSAISTGPTTALSNLATATTTWSRVENLNYSYDSSNYTVNYGTLTCENGICTIGNNVVAGSSTTPVKARLITLEELQSIANLEATKSNCEISLDFTGSDTKYFSYDGINCSSTCGGGNRTLGWLNENSEYSYNYGTINNGYGSNIYGYHTITPNSENYVYSIHLGYVTNYAIATSYGIRPVIKVEKDNIVLGNDIPEENVVNTDNNTNEVFHPGDIVYYDPVTTNTCDSSTFDLTKAKQWQSFCFKFRVIETNDSANKTDIKLMLDHNIIAKQTINGGTILPEAYLGNIMGAINGPTSSWTRVPLLNYSYDTSIDGSILGQSYGTLSCTNGQCGLIKNNMKRNLIGNCRVRPITPEEVDALNVYYGENPTYTKLFSNDSSCGGGFSSINLSSNLYWLYENTTYNSQTHATNNEYGDNNWGYWTLAQNINMSNRGDFWIVDADNSQLRTASTGNSSKGYRPVITVPKSDVVKE